MRSRTALQPLPSRTRVGDIDALRGFALLGILVVNITYMASDYPANLLDDPAFATGLDDAARFVTAALFSMKFYLLFSFLFGYSFVFQIQSAERAGVSFAARMLRRLLGLFVFGLAVIVLYGGDILTTYAVVGLLLLALRRVSDVVALRIAVVIYIAVFVSFVAIALFVDTAGYLPGQEEALANAAAQTQALLGGPLDIVRHNMAGVELLFIQSLSLQGPMALAMFLLGMVAARRKMFSGLDGTEPALRRIQLVGFPVGLAGGVGYALLGAQGDTLATAVSVLTSPFLTAAYGATFLRVLHHPLFGGLRGVLAPAGRMALTNYLGHAVVGVVLFTGVGLGLAGQVSPPLLIITAVAVFALQVVLSDWWLRRHRYGPAEYVLRAFTNWQSPCSYSRH